MRTITGSRACGSVAVTHRELYTKLDVPLKEQYAHEIKEAIKYARSCRTEIGFV